ncbi:seryl-tRNA synthetase [Entophlyctis luteolus]|nr:seryl-tRNA synthetase [Entophlyctis luteolus]
MTTVKRLLSTSTSHSVPVGPSRSFHAQLDYRAIKALTLSGDMLRNIRARNIPNLDPSKCVALYDQRVGLEFELDELRRQRNKIATEMASLAKAKNINSIASKAALAESGRNLKAQIAGLESRVSVLDSMLYEESRHLPNDTCPTSPVGDESKATTLDIINPHLMATKFETSKSHIDLCAIHDIADFARASKVSGTGFYFLKNFGALLELALCRYAMETLVEKHGFTPVSVPDVIRHEVLEGCGFSPRANTTDPQTYFLSTHLDAPPETQINADGVHLFDPLRLCLAATAEFPLAAMHAGEVLKPSELPIKYVGLGRAFRAEGLAGSVNRGLYRVHQFTKVEMFGIVAGGKKTGLQRSETMMEEFKSIQKSLFEDLDICFRILNMPTEELGAPAYKKYDMEAWMPGRNSWGEISSTSNCTDYQSRRLNIRNFKLSGESTTETTEFVHTINGTAAAIPRLIIALLETHQQQNGDVVIPEKLRPFLLNGKVDRIIAGESLQELTARLRK